MTTCRLHVVKTCRQKAGLQHPQQTVPHRIRVPVNIRQPEKKPPPDPLQLLWPALPQNTIPASPPPPKKKKKFKKIFPRTIPQWNSLSQWYILQTNYRFCLNLSLSLSLSHSLSLLSALIPPPPTSSTNAHTHIPPLIVIRHSLAFQLLYVTGNQGGED